MSTTFPKLMVNDLSFSRYISEINKIPSLTEEEEFAYVQKYIKFGDINAAHSLVSSHLKLVTKIVMRYRWYGFSLMELVSEGNIGLMHAVKKFTPDKGARLATYAMWWIKAAVQEYILKSWSLVKIGTTAAQKKLFFNLGKIKRKIRALEGREMNESDYQKIAQEYDVTSKDVSEMNVRMSRDGYLDDRISDDSGNATYLDYLESENSIDQENIIVENSDISYKRRLFNKACETLNEREKMVITHRRLQDTPSTLETLSKKLSISKERVRQIEEKAMHKLTENIRLLEAQPTTN